MAWAQGTGNWGEDTGLAGPFFSVDELLTL